MKITSKQREILKSLKCERLSSNDENLRLVEDFYNRRNPSLEQTLKNEAMEEDIDGSVAYYVIKDINDNILFFFSLKNGSLYDSYFDTNIIKLLKTLNVFVKESLEDSDLSEEQRLILCTKKQMI